MSPVCDSLTLWIEVGTSRALCGFFVVTQNYFG